MKQFLRAFGERFAQEVVVAGLDCRVLVAKAQLALLIDDAQRAAAVGGKVEPFDDGLATATHA